MKRKFEHLLFIAVVVPLLEALMGRVRKLVHKRGQKAYAAAADKGLLLIH